MHKLYQTVKEETIEPVVGNVTGDIPEWVNGSFYRNGPGMYEVGEYKYKHMLDPMAMLTRFHIENKKVTYQTRYLNGETYTKNMAAKRIAVDATGTLAFPDPNKNIFQRFKSHFEPKRSDNNNVSFCTVDDDLFACAETNIIHKIDPNTLETVSTVDLKNFAEIEDALAHPHKEPDGTLHNMCHSFKGGPSNLIVKFPPKTDKTEAFPKGQIVSAIKCPAKMSINYIHSFGMTDNYYVYIEQPMFVNLLKIIKSKVTGDPINSAIEYKPDMETRIRVIRRENGEEVNKDFKYEADPLLIFHHINTYEDNGQIVMDVCGFKTEDPLKFVFLKDIASEQCEATWRQTEEPEPRRYVIPLDITDKTPLKTNLVNLPNTKAVAERRSEKSIYCVWENMAPTGLELPAINYQQYNGKKYRYAYGVGWHREGSHFQTVCKIDTDSKTFTEWKGDKCYPSEPVFIPNPRADSEDDGILLSAVNRSNYETGNHAFLLVIDARTMTEIARVTFNVERFPRDTHGTFKPS